MEFPALPSNASDSNEYPGPGPSPSEGPIDNQKRRISSRSIKRRRFDDELVEFSKNMPGASGGGKGDKRVRTQSYTNPIPDISVTPNMNTMTLAPLASHSHNERRRSSKPIGGKKSRKKGQMSQLSTKDLGRWKPTDDLALILGVQQTNDIRLVHRGVKFSCRFLVSELQSRWYALLYNAEVSRVAVAAMRNLHPDIVASVQQQALYSIAEEDLLGTLTSTTDPNLDVFQELLDQNPHVFYPSRTAKSLLTHWKQLKQFHLLPDQVVQPLPKGNDDLMLSFSDAEDALNDAELNDVRDETLEHEMQMADRSEKIEIRLLEEAVPRWQVLVQSVAGGPADMDKHTLAVLRGRLVRYLMRSREIAVGRSTSDYSVDVDLSLEGPASKVSRRQGTIRLRNSGDFFLSSEGKRPMFVNGRPVMHGDKVKLTHNSVLEVSE